MLKDMSECLHAIVSQNLRQLIMIFQFGVNARCSQTEYVKKQTARSQIAEAFASEMSLVLYVSTSMSRI